MKRGFIIALLCTALLVPTINSVQAEIDAVYEENNADNIKESKRVEFESYSSSSGGSLKVENSTTSENEKITNIGGTYKDAWISYENVDFSLQGVDSINVRYANNEGRCATDSKLEIRLDSIDGEIVGEVDIPPTGGNWSIYKTVKAKLNKVITGSHNIYIVMKGSTTSSRPYIANLDYFYFDEVINDEAVKSVIDLIDDIGEVTYTEESLNKIVLAEEAYKKLNDDQKSQVSNYKILLKAREDYDKLIIENENFMDAYNTVEFERKTTDSGKGLKAENTTLIDGSVITNIGGTYDGAWMSYKNVNFDSIGANSIIVTYANNSNRCAPDARLEIRLGGVNGELIGNVPIPSTGGDWISYDKAKIQLDKVVTGMHDLYVVMKGTTTSSNPYIANLDNMYFGQEGDETKSQLVVNLISNIGEVKYDGDSLAKIVNAETEYDKLTRAQKDLVSNYDVLVKARSEYDALNDRFSGNRNAYEDIEVESMDSNSGFTLKVETTNVGGTAIRNITGTSDFSYIGFEGVKFEGNGANEITIRYANNSKVCPKNSRAEIRLGSKDGEVIGVVDLPNTADNWTTYKEAKAELNKVITGTNDIYVVLRGYTTKEHRNVANIDNITFTEVKEN